MIPLSGKSSGRPASFPHIPGFKSPVEVKQARDDAKTFWPRMVFVLLVGAALGGLLSGLLGIFTVPGVAAVCGLCCIVLTMVVIKEVQ
jgi:predicted lipid-binding transport protein (Tim44 family)